MSNKLAKGEQLTTERRGARPSFTTAAGYRIHYRHLSPETLPRLEAAARIALANERPELPTQRVQTGPDEWRDVENPHDEKYQKALEEWEGRVQLDQGQRFQTLCEQYALIYDVDQNEVDALKAAHVAIGDPLDGLTDEQIFLWKIALPMPEDQMLIWSKLFGGLTEEAIQAQKASFLSQLQGPAAAQGARPSAA